MKHKLLIIILLSSFASLISCKNVPLTVGKIVTQTRELQPFNEVYLNDNISMTLVRTDTCYIEIKTGENLIDNIITEVNGGVLTISNENTIDWIRTYDYELHATLYYKDIKEFVFSSSGTLNTKNQYNDTTGIYRFVIDGGSGDIDMLISKCHDMRLFYRHGTSRMNIHGDNNKAISIYKMSYGIFDARDYGAEFVSITSRSRGDCYVSFSDSLVADIQELGDVYYKGDPESIQVTYGEHAKGRLLPLN